jgi:hypothetical protein
VPDELGGLVRAAERGAQRDQHRDLRAARHGRAERAAAPVCPRAARAPGATGGTPVIGPAGRRGRRCGRAGEGAVPTQDRVDERVEPALAGAAGVLGAERLGPVAQRLQAGLRHRRRDAQRPQVDQPVVAAGVVDGPGRLGLPPAGGGGRRVGADQPAAQQLPQPRRRPDRPDLHVGSQAHQQPLPHPQPLRVRQRPQQLDDDPHLLDGEHPALQRRQPVGQAGEGLGVGQQSDCAGLRAAQQERQLGRTGQAEPGAVEQPVQLQRVPQQPGVRGVPAELTLLQPVLEHRQRAGVQLPGQHPLTHRHVTEASPDHRHSAFVAPRSGSGVRSRHRRPRLPPTGPSWREAAPVPSPGRSG